MLPSQELLFNTYTVPLLLLQNRGHCSNKLEQIDIVLIDDHG